MIFYIDFLYQISPKIRQDIGSYAYIFFCPVFKIWLSTNLHENSTSRLFADSRSQRKEVRTKKRVLYIRNLFVLLHKEPNNDGRNDDGNNNNNNFPLPVFSVISVILSLQYVWLIIVFMIGLWIQIITPVCSRWYLFTPIYITSKTCSNTGKSKQNF
jgi:hypothetical protein